MFPIINDEFKSNISTGVDSLLSLLKEKKSLSLPEAARILNVDESIVESWAKFLEETGDVSINYNLLTPYLSLNEEKNLNNKREPSLKQKFSNLSEKFEAVYDEALKFLKLKDYDSLNDSLQILSKEFNETFNNIQNKLSPEEKEEFQKELSEFNNKINVAWNHYKRNNILKSKVEYENALQKFYLLSDKLKDYLKDLSKLEEDKNSDLNDLNLNVSLSSEYNSLVEKAKKLLEQGDVEKAKEVYEQLKKLYHEELPKQFELQREMLKKNLFSLSKDLTFALDYEQKNRFEKGRKQIEDLLKKISESLKNNDFETVSNFMNYAITIFNKLPPGFEEEKKSLQEKIVDLNLKIANYKKKLLNEALSEELKEIENLRRKFYEKIEEKNIDEAKKIYSLLKKRYLLLPSEILPEKIDVHIKILEDFKKLSELQKNLFLEENNNKIKECKDLIKKISSLVEKNKIDEAEENYHILQKKIQEISDYFFEEKALLQNESLMVYKKIIEKIKDYYKVSFEKTYNDILSLINQGNVYVDKNNLQLAEETYVKALKLYSNLKPIFINKKKELKEKLFELYKKIVLKKDLNIVEEKSYSVHEKYNELLNLIIDAHHKIASNHLEVFPSIVDKILDLKNSIPKNVLNKNKSIVEEIEKLKEEKNIYLFAKNLENYILNKNVDVKKIDNNVKILLKYKSYLEKNVPEDNNLLSYVDDVISKAVYLKEKTIDKFVTIKHKKEKSKIEKSKDNKENEKSKINVKRLDDKNNKVKEESKIKNKIEKSNENNNKSNNENNDLNINEINSRIKKIKSILKS